MPCVACGPCACQPEMADVGVGFVQVDACECDGCWDRRRVQLDEEMAVWDRVMGRAPADESGDRP
ncbi:hypothetical protein D3C72_1737340 [compost metagenome]